MTRFPRLDEVSPTTWPELVEENAVDGCRVWNAWPKLEVIESPDAVCTFSPIPFALFNNVLRSQIDEKDLPARMEQVLDQYREARLPMLWWTGPGTRPADLGRRLQAAGLSSVGQTVGMVADLSRVNDSESVPGSLQIEETRSADSLEQWANLMTSVYAFPESSVSHWLELHASLGLGLDRPWRHFVASLEGRPVATASLFAGRASAAVANVATLPELRRRGIGRAITLTALCAARDLGYRIGTLFSSPAGQGVYRSLGFREVCHAECYCLAIE